MKIQNKILVLITLAAFVFTGIAATSYKGGHQQTTSFNVADTGRNLKVLPKNISEDSLIAIMEEWEHALGIGCGFCHVMDDGKGKEDYASDRMPAKERAREMFRMNSAINKQYFPVTKSFIAITKSPVQVTCNTCHRGKAIPEK